MNRAELLEFHKQFTTKMFDICKAKNSDYAGKGGEDPFANFGRVEAMGIASTEQGFLTRMLDKMSRLSSFVEAGTLEVKDESVEDTLMDLANYCLLMGAYLRSKNIVARFPIDNPDVEDTPLEIGDIVETPHGWSGPYVEFDRDNTDDGVIYTTHGVLRNKNSGEITYFESEELRKIQPFLIEVGQCVGIYGGTFTGTVQEIGSGHFNVHGAMNTDQDVIVQITYGAVTQHVHAYQLKDLCVFEQKEG